MEYRTLARTGVRVSSIALGTGSFGGWGNNDEADCALIVHEALNAGINFIDTADVYSGGRSEEIVGRALAGRRDSVFLATKAAMPMGSGPNDRGPTRLWIMRAVEASLRRLSVEYIDLYQIHRPDPDIDLEETLGALTDLIRAGKIRYAGSSAFPAWHMVEAAWTSERRGLARFVCEQPSYSLVNRAIEADVLPVAARHGLGIAVWSPLGGGLLTGKYRYGDAPEPDTRARRMRGSFLGAVVDPERAANAEKYALVERLQGVADAAGLPLPHLATAFTLAHPAVTATIIGPRTVEQLRASLAGADVRLDAATLDALDAIVPPGRTVDATDVGWQSPALAPSARRRALA